MAPKVTETIQEFKTLKVGAGGYLTGLALHGDGTLYVRADTYGAYRWDDRSRSWTQLITIDSLPEQDRRPGNAAGVYEIAVSPQNSTDVWIAYFDRIYRSRDKGKNWTLTGFPRSEGMDANYFNTKLLRRKMAVDPHDPEHVLAGAAKHGLWQTFDGGASWSHVDDVPNPEPLSENEATPGVSGLIFDPRNQGRIFASSYGHGVFSSENGGRSFTRFENGPTKNMRDCDFTADGVLIAVESDGDHPWRFDGEWTATTGPDNIKEAGWVTCDPFDANRVFFMTEGGRPILSLDGGRTILPTNWSPNWQGSEFDPPDIPWHTVDEGKYMSVGAVAFDPNKKNEIVVSNGIGVLRGVIASDGEQGTIHYTHMSRGIEELVANQLIATPNGNIGLASWDRSYFRIEDPDEFPDHYEGNYGETIVHCTGIDWCAQDPDVIALVNFQLGSGVSRDGGKSFERFTAPFPDYAGGGGGGNIAVSGPDNYVWAPTASMQPQFTRDGGKSWGAITLPGIPNKKEGWDGINWGYYLQRQIVAADRIKSGTFYMWHASAGIFVSRDGGEKWAQVFGGELLPYGNFNAKMKSVPGYEGHLFATSGPLAGDDASGSLLRSINGGKNWSSVDGVLEVTDVGFGAVPPGGSYPAVWIIGYVNNKYGIYRSDDGCKNWVLVSRFPLGYLDHINTIDGDKRVHDRCYIGFGGAGYAYAPGGKSAALTPHTEPGFIMVPAAMAYRFGKRWSDLKAAHRELEREARAALADDAAMSHLGAAARKRLMGLIGK